MSTTLVIGGIILLLAVIAMIVFWIVGLVKIFKAGDTVWGVLSIFFAPIVPIIWGFLNNQQKYSIFYIIAFVVAIVSYIMVGAGAFMMLEDMDPQQLEGLQQELENIQQEGSLPQ